MSDAMMGSGAQAVGGATSLAGGIMQGNAARQQGLYQNRVAQINAQLSQMQAKDAIMRGDLASSTALVKGEQQVSAQRTAMGAGGVDPNSGSAAQAQASTKAISQLDALTISHNANLEALGYNLQGANSIAAGKMAKIAGDNNNVMDITAGGLKFGQSIMQGASNYAQYRPRVPGAPTSVWGSWGTGFQGGPGQSTQSLMGPEDAAQVEHSSDVAPLDN